MFLLNLIISTAAVSSLANGLQREAKSLDDYVNAIRKSAVVEGFPAPVALKPHPKPALVEIENLKKPLSVSQFSEWLHNLYYDEEKKRKSAIKYMLDNQFGKSSDSQSTDFE
jgi:hypothetical protein